MGNILSRCAQNVRHALRTCSKKHPEDEAMLSTCDSEPLDKCQEPMFGPAMTNTLSRSGSQSSLVRLQDKMETVNCKIVSTTPKARLKLHPHISNKLDGYSSLVSSPEADVDHVVAKEKTLVDRESQTYSEELAGPETKSPAAILSKEYIVRTYSIQNATPSPATQAKFSPVHEATRKVHT